MDDAWKTLACAVLLVLHAPGAAQEPGAAERERQGGRGTSVSLAAGPLRVPAPFVSSCGYGRDERAWGLTGAVAIEYRGAQRLRPVATGGVQFQPQVACALIPPPPGTYTVKAFYAHPRQTMAWASLGVALDPGILTGLRMASGIGIIGAAGEAVPFGRLAAGWRSDGGWGADLVARVYRLRYDEFRETWVQGRRSERELVARGATDWPLGIGLSLVLGTWP